VDNHLHTTSRGGSTHLDSVNKNLACGAFSFTSFACGAVLSQKNLACRTFFLSKILSMGHSISVPSLVYRFIDVENDSNSKNQ